MPPAWAQIPDDKELYLRAPVTDIPECIPLTELAQCSCGAAYSNTMATSFQDCIVYTLTQAFQTVIKVQICHQCSSGRRRYVGPDAREMGLFNWNNRALFTHELLDDYTAAYTSSETPFVAWVNNLSRRYTGRGSPAAFVTEAMFRAAWFAYSALQVFENDMQCSICGPNPEAVIWDGVTLAFSRKQLLLSLCPPTTLHNDSPAYNAKYIKSQTLLVEAKMRKGVRRVIDGQSLIKLLRKVDPAKAYSGPADGNEDDEGEDDGDSNELIAEKSKEMKEIYSRLDAVPDVCRWLGDIHSGLGHLFKTHFGMESIIRGKEPPAIYVRLFRQVRLLTEECCTLTYHRRNTDRCGRVRPADDYSTDSEDPDGVQCQSNFTQRGPAVGDSSGLSCSTV